jgi:cephalosporin hydroxylase
MEGQPITELYGKYWKNITVTQLKSIIAKFHEAIYYLGVQFSTKWMGCKVLKNPSDLWNLQEIIVERRPDVIIETGTAAGGSALFMAQIMDLMNHQNGKIITVDIDRPEVLPAHKRIVYMIGSSTDSRVVDAIKQQIPNGASVMVILDSDHNEKHVTKELSIYAKMVTVGQYLIVEDSNIHGNPIKLVSFKDGTKGPMASIQKFIKHNKQFIHDDVREHKFLLTFHPKGWLKRVQ